MNAPTRRQAVALAYDHTAGDGAPRVLAKGYGLVADMIVQRAREAGLYVHESPEMVSLLMQVDMDSTIPPLLYQAVAELLAWLYRLEADAGAKAGAGVVGGGAVGGGAVGAGAVGAGVVAGGAVAGTAAGASAPGAAQGSLPGGVLKPASA